MRENLFDLLVGISENITAIEILQRIGFAFGLALVLYWTYLLSYSSVVYNRKFNTSLIMITIMK